MPIVTDYYWHFGSRSPRNYWKIGATGHHNDESSAARKARLDALHAKWAPEVLQVMLDLKGLYVKLGQVLSVTALPIPEIYRQHFRTLQSDVPGYEEFQVVQQVLQKELHTQDLDAIFSFIDPVPCGAASIGQAHRAILRTDDDDDNGDKKSLPREVIIKVQYPDASWQVPADIQCVGDLLQVCIWTGVVDESAAQISFDDFARQFRAELDYTAEAQNLQETYLSYVTNQPQNPYKKHGVVVPHIYPELCTQKVITMSYLKGPKLEEEARRQLESLGIDTSKGIANLVRAAGQNEVEDSDGTEMVDVATANNSQNLSNSWKSNVAQHIGRWVGVDTILWTVRSAQRLVLWTGTIAFHGLGLVSPLLPESWNEWRKSRLLSYQKSKGLAQTGNWINALLDVHGYQIFQQGLFNADCHPGNILVLDDGKLGLIDYGQCKRLSSEEQAGVARLLLSVANKESDENVARAFRNLGVKTRNDSTEFLAEMARLMFGRFESQHLNHSYHRQLHKMDRITYFPKELSMVYRTALLLRGLAVSLQTNPSVAEQWREHAQVAIDRNAITHNAISSKKKTVRRFTTSVRPVQGAKHQGMELRGVA